MDVLVVTRQHYLSCSVDGGVLEQRQAGSIAEALSAGEIGGILIAVEGEAIELACELRREFAVPPIPIAVSSEFSSDVATNTPCRRFFSTVKSLVRAVPPREPHSRELRIDPRGRDITVCGRRWSCSPMEFRLLTLFLRYPGVVFSREELIRTIRANDSPIDPAMVNVLVERLRKKVETTVMAPRNLQSVRGLGYVYWNNGDVVMDAITNARYVTWPCSSHPRAL
jgi:DNA-binding winged helix-turn-helix (wHTH) protein